MFIKKLTYLVYLGFWFSRVMQQYTEITPEYCLNHSTNMFLIIGHCMCAHYHDAGHAQSLGRYSWVENRSSSLPNLFHYS